jgi:hypothetical protein
VATGPKSVGWTEKSPTFLVHNAAEMSKIECRNKDNEHSRVRRRHAYVDVFLAFNVPYSKQTVGDARVGTVRVE